MKTEQIKHTAAALAAANGTGSHVERALLNVVSWLTKRSQQGIVTIILDDMLAACDPLTKIDRAILPNGQQIDHSVQQLCDIRTALKDQTHPSSEFIRTCIIKWGCTALVLVQLLAVAHSTIASDAAIVEILTGSE